MAPGSGLDEIMENAVTELKSDFPKAVAVKFDKGVTAGVGGHPVVEDSEIAGAKLAGARFSESATNDSCKAVLNERGAVFCPLYSLIVALFRKMC